MVGIYLVVAVVTRKEMATHSRCTAMEYVLEGAVMTWHHFFTIPIQILIAITAKNIRNFQHGFPVKRSEVGHEVVNSIVHGFHGALGQVHVEEGCPDALMSQQGLDDTEINPFFQ